MSKKKEGSSCETNTNHEWPSNLLHKCRRRGRFQLLVHVDVSCEGTIGVHIIDLRRVKAMEERKCAALA